jgi:hypothetical protein
MGDVIEAHFISRVHIPVDKVVHGIVQAQTDCPFKRVLFIGVYEDGEVYYAFSDPDGGTAMWDMELLKFALVKVAAGGEP